MINSKILNSNSNEWNSVLNKFPEHYNQLHFTKEYHQLMEKNGDGIAKLFVFKENEKYFIIPFIQRELKKIGDYIIQEELYDIKSVFGYTGIISNTSETNFNDKAINAFIGYCVDQNIISGLLRFNPIINNQNLFEDKIKLTSLKKYVYLDLEIDSEQLLSGYKSRLRSYVRKAEKKYSKNVFFSTEDKDLDEFFNLYIAHMKEIEVDNYYLFNDNYFNKLKEIIKDNGFLIFARLDNKIVAGLIFLYHKQVAYYHHGARDMQFKDASLINKLLFHKALSKLIDEKIKYCLLGGGVENHENDSLYRFKKSFGGKVSDFFIGKKVFMPAKYKEVIDLWEEKFPELIDKYSHFIDKYSFSS